MADKTLKILSSEEIANGTRAFHLERPAGFDYEAGQTVDFTLIDPTDMDAEGPVRTFSLVSAPHEPELEFATRIRDTAFKRTIKTAPSGTELAWDGPYGSFTLHKNAATPAVFLAGGIGVTPFMSIVKDALHKRLQHQLFLFHSNKTPEDTPFFHTLTALDHSDPNFHYVPTMTGELPLLSKEGAGGGSWTGDQGFITKDMIERHVSDLATPIFYLAGPPAFVAAMRKMLAAAGADEDNIRFEEFPGY